MTKQRNSTIDIARGIAIIVMIMGHVEIGILEHDSWFSIWYHAWHMPIFFIVSGYFFNGKEYGGSLVNDNGTGCGFFANENGYDCRANGGSKYPGDYISKKARQLLVPFLFWGMFNAFYELISSGDWLMFRATIIHSFFEKPTDGVPGAGALWFLPAMFWLNVIYFVITKCFESKWMSWLAGFVIGFIGMVAESKGIYLPFGIDGGLTGLPFIVAGDMFRCWENKVQASSDTVENQSGKSRPARISLMHLPWFIFAPAFVVFNYLFIANGLVNFRAGQYQNYPLTFINAVAGAILLLNVARVIDSVGAGVGVTGRGSVGATDRDGNGVIGSVEARTNDSHSASGTVHGYAKVAGFLATLGHQSLIYLCLNQRVIALVKPVFMPYWGPSIVGCYRCFILTTVIVILVCYVAHHILVGSRVLKCSVGK